VNLTAKLLKVINGSFNHVQREEDGNTVFNFTIPFRMADFSKQPYVHIPSLHALVELPIGQSNYNMIHKSDKSIHNSCMRFEQESGNERSNNFQSKNVLSKKNNSINTSEIGSVQNYFPGEDSNTDVYVRTKRLFVDKKDLASTVFKANIENMSPELRITNRQGEFNND
jgi:hypothetical protein